MKNVLPPQTLLGPANAGQSQTTRLVDMRPQVQAIVALTLAGQQGTIAGTVALQGSCAVPPSGIDVLGDWQPPPSTWLPLSDVNGNPITANVSANGITWLSVGGQGAVIPPWVRVVYTYTSGFGGTVQVDLFARGWPA